MENNKSIKDTKAIYRKLISLNDIEDDHCGLLPNAYITIPAYQRPYSWQKENVEQLLYDIEYRIKSYENEDYFMGTILCIQHEQQIGEENKPGKTELVDGQQRLTTFILILIYLKAKNLDNKYIDQKYIDQINQIKFVSEAKNDNEILQWIIQYSKNSQNLIGDINEKRKMSKSNLSLFEQYTIFLNALKVIDNFFSKTKILDEKIISYIFNHIKLVQISAEPNSLIGDDFFISLNGKGLKLSQIDLLKCTFIHPYMKEKITIDEFKKKWSGLIDNTNNEMETKISNYFDAYLNKIIPYSKLDNSIIKEYKIKNEFEQESKIKKEFEKMCNFFKNYSLFLNTCPPKIEFWIKLFKKISNMLYEKILFLILIQIDDFKKYIQQISDILATLFKITFIYLKVLNKRPAIFAEKIIHWHIKNNSTIDQIKDKLHTTLENILNGNDENLHDEFSKFKFDPEISCNYEKKDDKNKNDFTYLVFLIQKFYSNETNNINFGSAVSFMKNGFDLDHIVAKSAIYTKDGKNIKAWTQAEDKNKITFDNEFFSKIIANDKKFVKKYSITQKMYHSDFEKILNKSFNLQILDSNDNKSKSSKTYKPINELAKIFTIKNEKIVNENLIKTWNWFFGIKSN